MLLSQLLHTRGIESIVLERKTKEYVLSRIRTGVLEQGLNGPLAQAGGADRSHAESYTRDCTLVSHGDEMFRIGSKEHTGTPVVVYGQTEVTRDLYEAREKAGGQIEFNVGDVVIHDADGDPPHVSYAVGGEARRIDCDFVAGCDGFHRVSRKTIPQDMRREYEKVYPFGWLGILSETPSVNHKLIYANSPHGFALASMRNENLCRCYIQCPLEDWSGESFWRDFEKHIPADQAEKLVTGPSIEKSITPPRSCLTEPMPWVHLFLCGDAHSQKALSRVWKAGRFSWWFSSLMHRYPNQTEFDHRIQVAELQFLRSNKAAQKAMTGNYVGLPY